jgi:carbonic anhydrase
MGLAPGEVFVQRNVGNQALHNDMNSQSCIEYAVKTLKVKTILVCGHYNCGAVRAALQLPSRTPGLVNCWISDIREARNQAASELEALDTEDAVARLCELNVLRQVRGVGGRWGVKGAQHTPCREGRGAPCREGRRGGGASSQRRGWPASRAADAAAAGRPPARPLQVFHVCTSPVVQSAWAEGAELQVVG